MDVNEHERLSSITLRHKLSQRNNTFISHYIMLVCCKLLYRRIHQWTNYQRKGKGLIQFPLCEPLCISTRTSLCAVEYKSFIKGQLITLPGHLIILKHQNFLCNVSSNFVCLFVHCLCLNCFVCSSIKNIKNYIFYLKY